MSAPVQLFGAVHAALEAELDWELLGRTYCDGDGSTFFDSSLRERMLDTGLWIADDLANRLAAVGPRRSLYLGAAVAEIPVMLAEQLVLGREVLWLNLDSVELREIARALSEVGKRHGVSLSAPSFESLERVPVESCDHLWMVSVLTDPDVFPALHDELYARAKSELATGRGSLSEELPRAQALSLELLARALLPCTLTTSDEELEVLLPLAQQLNLTLEVPEASRISAVVGDRIRCCSVRR